VVQCAQGLLLTEEGPVDHLVIDTPHFIIKETEAVNDCVYPWPQVGEGDLDPKSIFNQELCVAR
jgi:hypothetical protein